MELKGIIKSISPVIEIKTFKKIELVLNTIEHYPQTILVDFTKVDLLDLFNVGDEVVIKVQLKGREWTNPQGQKKYFNTIGGWAIKKIDTNPINNNLAPALDVLPF